MTDLEKGLYEHTDEEVAVVHDAVVAYILRNETKGLPLGYRGLYVFAAISALREHDEELHGDTSTLDDDQRARLEEIESKIDEAVENKEQYYPFGHCRNEYAVPHDTAHRDRAAEKRNWWNPGRASKPHVPSHLGEPFAPKAKKKD